MKYVFYATFVLCFSVIAALLVVGPSTEPQGFSLQLSACLIALVTPVLFGVFVIRRGFRDVSERNR